MSKWHRTAYMKHYIIETTYLLVAFTLCRVDTCSAAAVWWILT